MTRAVRFWSASIAGAVLCASSLAVRAQDVTPKKTVWDGVYTEAQAARGQQSYKAICGHCHRDDLTGGGSEAGAPALVGPIFTVRWRDQPLSDMFLAIGTTMPKNRPDSVMPSVVIDIVSFILKANGVPSGSHELPPNLAALETTRYTER